MNKRIFSLLLVFTMCFSLLPKAACLSAAAAEDREDDSNGELSFVPGYIPEDYGYVYPSSTYDVGTALLFDSLPSSYDGREYQTPVKDQGSNGLCWAFAACSALEANMKKNGLGEQDFSELHMGYSTSTYMYKGTMVNNDQGFNRNTITGGGNREYAAAYLMRGTSLSGTVNESDDKYVSRVTNLRDPAITQSKQKTWYARDILYLSGNGKLTEAQVPAVKGAVMQYGAVNASMYWPDDASADSWADYYNTASCAYYCSKSAANTNHAVLIVGWDDDYDKTNFLEENRPSNNGAWLVKNSWGINRFGNGGYFWISYEDTAFPQYAAAFSGADKWDPDSGYVYESDYKSVNGGVSSSENSVTFAKVFPINAECDKLDSVRLFISASSGATTVEVDVLPSFTGFEEYTFVADAIRLVTYPGWYTIDLPEQVKLAVSGQFAVVVKLTGKASVGTDSFNELGSSSAYLGIGGGALSSSSFNWAIKAVGERSKELPASPSRPRVAAYDGTVTISWPAVPHAASYSLERRTVENGVYGDWVELASDIEGSSYQDTEVVIGTRYAYRLRAVNAYGASGYSESAEITATDAPGGRCGDGLSWTLSDGVLTIGGSGQMKNYVFYAYKEDGRPPWYGMRSDIQTVIVEDCVESIGDMAFYDCTSLTDVSLGNSVATIGRAAFGNCTSLTDVVLGNSVVSIGDSAFSNCKSLTDAVLGNSVVTIGSGAFSNCKLLWSAAIPKSVTSIGSQAFYNCEELARIDIPAGVTSIKDETFYRCVSLVSISIPSSVTVIGKKAFYYCSLENVYYQGSAEQWNEIVIGSGNEELTCLNVHYNSTGPTTTWALSDDGVLTIGGTGDMETYCFGSAPWFRSCGDIKSVVIKNGVTSIGGYSFYSCENLTGITIPESVTSIGSWAFAQCVSLGGIQLPQSLRSMGEHAFSGCKSLSQIDIPAGVTSIADATFQGCALKSVTIPDGVTSIGHGAFNGCKALESVTIPDSVTSIGDWAFYGCASLMSVTVPDGVESINENVFYDCALTSVTIPASVTSIGQGAFYGCDLKDVYYGGSRTQWQSVTVDPTAGGGLSAARIHYGVSKEPAVDADVLSGGILSYAVTDAPEGSLLIAARYNGGRMTDMQTVQVSGDVSEELTMKGSGTTFMIFLVDGEAFTPLCSAWKSDP